MKQNNIDHLTFHGEVKAIYNDLDKEIMFKPVKMWVDYSIEKDGKTTTVSLSPNRGITMITFNYQELKMLVEGNNKHGTMD